MQQLTELLESTLCWSSFCARLVKNFCYNKDVSQSLKSPSKQYENSVAQEIFSISSITYLILLVLLYSHAINSLSALEFIIIIIDFFTSSSSIMQQEVDH